MAILTESQSHIEKIMCEVLQEEGYDFEEQYRIYEKGNSFSPKYIADFLVEHNGTKLIVECDGFSFHSKRDDILRDAERDAWLVYNGYKVVHFTSTEIKYHMADVLEKIDSCLGIKCSEEKKREREKRKAKDRFIVNVTEDNMHYVALYYDALKIKDMCLLSYYFYDVTKKYLSETRRVCFFNVPKGRGEPLALYTCLKDLKRSTWLKVYCQSSFLSDFFNNETKSIKKDCLRDAIGGILKKHNYRMTYIGGDVRQGSAVIKTMAASNLQQLRTENETILSMARNRKLQITYLDYFDFVEPIEIEWVLNDK